MNNILYGKFCSAITYQFMSIPVIYVLLRLPGNLMPLVARKTRQAYNDKIDSLKLKEIIHK